MMNKREPLPPNYEKLLNVLRLGKENATSSREIEQLTGISSRDTGAFTADLIIRYGYRIGSSRVKPYGYYLIEDEQELKDTLRSLNNEMQGILNRHKALQANFYAAE